MCQFRLEIRPMYAPMVGTTYTSELECVGLNKTKVRREKESMAKMMDLTINLFLYVYTRVLLGILSSSLSDLTKSEVG